MAYNKLQNFQPIYENTDFDFISSKHSIDELFLIIKQEIKIIDEKNVSNRITKIETFMLSLQNFCKNINYSAVPDLVHGYNEVEYQLIQVKNIFNQPLNKRSQISAGYLRKMNKRLVHGLNKFLKGLRESFHPNYLSKMNYNADLIVRYILDEKEGIRHKFKLYDKEEDSFVKKLYELQKNELMVALRLISNPANQVRTINGWTDLGLGKTDIRILEIKKLFMTVLCYLYRNNNNDKKNYEVKIREKPDIKKYL